MQPDSRHRARRHAAYGQAADAHRRAADLEREAAAYFDRIGEREVAERHRLAGRRQAELAQADSDRAADWA
jgi:hypothetical protein